MADLCPHCGQPVPETAPPLGVTAESLLRWCEQNGCIVLAGERVREGVAARILDRSPGTLANWRSAGGPPDKPLPVCMVNGRATYRLADIARYLSG